MSKNLEMGLGQTPDSRRIGPCSQEQSTEEMDRLLTEILEAKRLDLPNLADLAKNPGCGSIYRGAAIGRITEMSAVQYTSLLLPLADAGYEQDVEVRRDAYVALLDFAEKYPQDLEEAERKYYQWKKENPPKYPGNEEKGYLMEIRIEDLENTFPERFTPERLKERCQQYQEITGKEFSISAMKILIAEELAHKLIYVNPILYLALRMEGRQRRLEDDRV